MTFNPNQPMGMPPMPPMMSSGYTFTPMGMMSMGMGMMPPTTAVMRPLVTNTLTTQRPKKQLVPQEIPGKDDKKDEKPPVTTIFVGNISERAPDSMIRTMLQRCGNVLSWKRVQGPSGKLQAFGFCEYEDPEATLRCMRLLNDWEIADKKLVVKVDAKTKTLLDDYRHKKREEDSKEKDDKEKNGDEKEDGEMDKDDNEKEDELDEFTKREDRVAKAGLDAIMREYAFELAKEPAYTKTVKEYVSDIPKVPMPPIKNKKEDILLKDTGLDDMKIEEEKKELINREIAKFRDVYHKDDDPKSEEERDAEKERERLRRWRSEQKKKELEALAKMMTQETERSTERRLKPRHSRSRSRSRSSSRGRTARRERSRSRDRDWEREKERERYKRDRDRDMEEEEEAYERRKLEKKIREKEMAYQERLKNWELRERKKAREYEKEKEREDERRAEETREARRLREFLEDYDDERDDPKFYKGSALERRLRDRQKEKEADARDRAKEKEELEEIKRKLFEEGHPDPETEIARIERERAEHLRPMLQIKENIPTTPSDHEEEEEKPESVKEESEDEEKYQIPPNMKPTLQPVEDSSRSNSASPVTADDGEESRLSIAMDEDSSQPVNGPSREDSNSKLGFGSLKFGNMSPSDMQSGKRKKLTVGDVFNTDDDDSADGAKKRKLVPLDYDDEKIDKKPSTAEEKRAKIKTLIESIPTAKDELFAYSLDWSIVDQGLMDKRIKPWVNKKIIEYIGEEEPTLTNFICQKVMAQSLPQNILNDVAMVLDEEAEVFVVKMWRLLVYETEAKKAGLVK